jgi:hypothetical protein
MFGDGPKPDLTDITKVFHHPKVQAEVVPLLKEVDIEYPWIARQGLLVRCALAFVSVITLTHMINTDPRFKADMEKLRNAPPADVGDLGTGL